MTKIIVFNGPPRSGKDTAAHIIQQYFGSDTVAHLKLSTPLKRFVSELSGLSIPQLEEGKEQPLLFGQTVSSRDLQIGIYEAISKVAGRDWLAQIVVHKINTVEQSIVVLSDGGRPEEIDKLVRNFGASNILLLQLFRKGTSFQGDIRQYIYDSRIVTQPVMNEDLQQFKIDIIDEVTSWLA